MLQAQYTYGRWIDEVLIMEKGGNAYYYHTNSLGSIVALTDSAGDEVERYTYDAYGKVSITDGAGDPLGSSAVSNPYMFTGRRLDEEAGLYYYRARYYDCERGRFLQRDPMRYVDGMNLYEYVYSSPKNHRDPYGLNGDAFIDKAKKELQDRFDKALASVGGAKTKTGKKFEKAFKNAKDQLNKLAEKAGPASAARVTLILNYAEFEIRTGLITIDALNLICLKKQACNVCVRTEDTYKKVRGKGTFWCPKEKGEYFGTSLFWSGKKLTPIVCRVLGVGGKHIYALALNTWVKCE